MGPTPEETALTSDEELQKTRVEELKPHNAPITLVEYDPGWPRLFDREANRVRSLLGETAVRIEHAGSTSVPGLAAKPIVDMILVVPDSADEPAYAPALEAAGYRMTIREPEWLEHRLFKGPDTNINLHVFTDGEPEVDRMVAFRDWLRTHDEDRVRYEQVKRELAVKTWRHVDHYAEAKSAVIKDVLAKAGHGG